MISNHGSHATFNKISNKVLKLVLRYRAFYFLKFSYREKFSDKILFWDVQKNKKKHRDVINLRFFKKQHTFG